MVHAIPQSLAGQSDFAIIVASKRRLVGLVCGATLDLEEYNE